MKTARALKVRLEILEERFGDISGERQVEMYSRCVRGDRQAVQYFERIIASGKAVPLLANLFELFRAGPSRCPAGPKKDEPV
jgi:hypothetical protein